MSSSNLNGVSSTQKLQVQTFICKRLLQLAAAVYSIAVRVGARVQLVTVTGNRMKS